MKAELVGAAERDQGCDRDQAAIARSRLDRPGRSQDIPDRCSRRVQGQYHRMDCVERSVHQIYGISPYLLMTDDGMRHIRLFQVCDLFLGQFNGQSADGIFQMRDLRCPDDRRRHRLLL
jgi:hypothetical protein